METLLRTTGVVGFLVFLAAMWMEKFHGFRMIRLEFAKDASEANEILQDQQQKARENVEADFLFIAAYWSFFILMSAVAGASGFSGSFAFAACIAVFSTGAALFDILENLRLFTLFDSFQITNEMVFAIRRATLYKWFCLFLSIGLLSPIFLTRHSWIPFIGVLLILISVLGFAGIRNTSLILPALIALIFLLPIIFILFSFMPHIFLTA